MRSIRGKDGPWADYTAVSRATFTDPEVGSVGMTEAQAREAGIRVTTGSYQLPYSSRGWIHKSGNHGVIKVVADADRIRPRINMVSGGESSYFADEGDFSSAGAAHIDYFLKLDSALAQLTAALEGAEVLQGDIREPGSARAVPVVGMGSWMVRVTRAGRTVNSPFRITCRLPLMLTGTTGSCASMATTKGPFLKRPITPSTLRVPSGNTISELDSPTRRFIFSTMSAPGFRRSTSR